ncbi:hypothetical protein [Streptomyces noursei]|uniref:hypothetical protein n=1 Tax=Streptomyces noursei TaxID=1971 RepID=UPI00382798BB
MVTTMSFRHPGVLFSAEQLDHVRAKVRSGQEPWQTAYRQMTGSEFARLDWQPTPVEVVDCGSGDGGNPWCGRERRDGLVACTHALAWVLTGDAAHAHQCADPADHAEKHARSHESASSSSARRFHSAER